MKQCAGCGKRYDKAQPNCPSCWSRSWVPAPEGRVPAALPSNPTPCAECGFLAAAGTAKCPHCGSKLRPNALEWLCLLGLLGCPVAVVMLGLGLRENPWGIADMVLCAALFPACLGLLRGRYRAWLAMRLLLIATPLLLIALIVVTEITKDFVQVQVFAGMLLCRFIGVVLLWVYFHSSSVQDYCTAGKPAELREQTAALFPEQMMAQRRSNAVKLDTLYRDL